MKVVKKDAPCAAGVRGVLLVVLFFIGAVSSSRAHADPTLLLDEPPVGEQSVRYQLTVFEDGIARLHFKSSDQGTPVKLDAVVLSAFKADGHPAVVVGLGLEGRNDAQLPYLRDVSLSSQAAPLRLNGSGLDPDVLYSGDLSAAVKGGKTLIWHVSLIRPGAMAPFACPPVAQVLNQDGSSNFEFRRLSPGGIKPIQVQLSTFVSRDLEVGQVGFRPKGANAAASLVNEEEVGEAEAVSPIRTSGLSEGETYSGKVRFVRESKGVLECLLDLQMPRTARGELVSDASTLTRQVTIGEPYSDSATSFVVHLFEKSRTKRLDGISAYLDGPGESPEGSLDLHRHVSVSLGDKSANPDRFAPDLTLLCQQGCGDSKPDARAILKGEQRDMHLGVHDLQAGQYAFTLRLAAIAAIGTLPRIDVIVNVRHWWLYAALVAVLSSILSFFITKGFVNWRERGRILAHIRELERDSANDHPELPSTTFLRAIVDQTETLIKPLKYFAPPDSVYDYVARAERTAAVLRKYSVVWSALKDAECPDYVKLHYREAIAAAMRRMGPGPLDQQTADAVVQDLTTIATHLVEPMAWYWSILKTKAQSLALAALAVGNQLDHDAVVARLLATLQAPPPTPTREFDEVYWVVNLLYSRRDAPEDIAALVAAYHPNQLAALLRLGDQLIWTRLEKAIGKGQVAIATPPSSEPHETLQPIAYMLCFDDPVLADSYFIHDVLRYEWVFELTSGKKAEDRTAATWTRTLNGPRITQYARRAGTFSVKVRIKSPFDPDAVALTIGPKTLQIRDNSELSFTQSLNATEVLLTLGISAVALITSLPALYFSKPTFGSFADYAAILAWAVGLDQGKNLVQAMKTLPGGDAPAARVGSGGGSGQ